MKQMKLTIEMVKEKILKLPDTFLFVASFLCAMALWPLDLYLYRDLNTPLYFFIKIFFMSLFIFFYLVILIFSYLKRGNLFYFGLIIYIIAFLFIILPFFNIYLLLYEEAPWGNTLASETFYLGCFLFLLGSFVLNYDIFFKNKRIVFDIRKIPEETKGNIIRSFLTLSGLFFAFNLWDFNGLLLPIYYGLEYAPEPLMLERVPYLSQFMINTIMVGIWLTIFIYFLHRKRYLGDNIIKFSLVSVIILTVISVIMIVSCRNIPIPYDLQRYVIQPIPSWLIVIPLFLILKTSINIEKKRG
jgi:hypothetical protein